MSKTEKISLQELIDEVRPERTSFQRSKAKLPGDVQLYFSSELVKHMSEHHLVRSATLANMILALSDTHTVDPELLGMASEISKRLYERGFREPYLTMTILTKVQSEIDAASGLPKVKLSKIVKDAQSAISRWKDTILGKQFPSFQKPMKDTDISGLTDVDANAASYEAIHSVLNAVSDSQRKEVEQWIKEYQELKSPSVGDVEAPKRELIRKISSETGLSDVEVLLLISLKAEEQAEVLKYVQKQGMFEWLSYVGLTLVMMAQLFCWLVPNVNGFGTLAGFLVAGIAAYSGFISFALVMALGIVMKTLFTLVGSQVRDAVDWFPKWARMIGVFVSGLPVLVHLVALVWGVAVAIKTGDANQFCLVFQNGPLHGYYNATTEKLFPLLTSTPDWIKGQVSASWAASLETWRHLSGIASRAGTGFM